MPAFKKRHGRYIIRFKRTDRQPKEKSESLPNKISKREVKRIEGEMNAAYFSGEWNPWDRTWRQYKNGEELGTYSVGEAIDDYILHCKRNNRWNSPSTVRNNKEQLGWFMDFIGEDTPVSEITNRYVSQYFEGKDVKATTKTTYFRNYKAFHNWLLDNGYNSNQIEYAPPKKESNRILHFRESELKTLISYVHGSGRDTAQVYDDIWSLMFYQCLRAGEVFCETSNNSSGIMPQHIQGKRITVHGKGGKIRVIPLVAPIGDRLLELKYEAEKIGQATIFPFRSQNAFFRHTKQIIRKALPESREVLNLHSLRRGGAVYWTEKGVPLAALKELLGHYSIKTTERHYGRFQPSGMDKIFGSSG